MAQTPTISSSSIESQGVLIKQIAVAVHINGNLVDAGTNINAYTDVADVIAYVAQAGVQPVPADTGTNFPAFTSLLLPSTMGIVAYCGDADQSGFGLMDSHVPSFLVVGVLGMTDGVVSPWGFANTGITVSKNLALEVSCTGANFNSATGVSTFRLITLYKSMVV